MEEYIDAIFGNSVNYNQEIVDKFIQDILTGRIIILQDRFYGTIGRWIGLPDETLSETQYKLLRFAYAESEFPKRNKVSFKWLRRIVRKMLFKKYCK